MHPVALAGKQLWWTSKTQFRFFCLGHLNYLVGKADWGFCPKLIFGLHSRGSWAMQISLRAKIWFCHIPLLFVEPQSWMAGERAVPGWYWREAFLKCISFSAMPRIPNITFLQSQSFVDPVSGVLKHPPTVFNPSCLQQIQDPEQDRNLLAFAGLKTIQQQSSATWADCRVWPFLGVWKPGRPGGVWSRESSGALQHQRYPPEWTTRNIPAVGFCLNSL